MDLKSLIRDVPNFPKPGIVFKDICPLLSHPQGLTVISQSLAALAAPARPTVISAIESRGFIFGAALAQHLGLPFVPMRKPGKLPGETYSMEFKLEYGSDRLEVHCDAFAAADRVAIVDDVLATGGTAQAAGELVRKVGATPSLYLFVIALDFLKGQERLGQVPWHALVHY